MQNGHKVVVDRAPFVKSGEVIVQANTTGNVLPDSALMHHMDRPFEAAFVTFKLTALAKGAVTDPQPDVLDRLIKVRMVDCARNHPLGNSLPLTCVGDGVYRWTPKQPFQLLRGDSFQTQIDTRSFEIAIDGHLRQIDAIRVEVALEGELLTYGPPLEAPAKQFEGEAPLPG